MHDEIFTVRRFPLPRIRIGELGHPTHQRQTRRDRPLVTEKPRSLLTFPPRQHRFEHCLFGLEMHYPVGQHQMRRTRNLSLAHALH